MLTALSVACDCHMMAPQEHVILVQVQVSDLNEPSLHWTYADSTSRSVVQEVTTTTTTQVSDL